MRGLACVLMFQTHCYDAWLSPQARKTTFFMYSQLGGTLPAPLFLFLAGVSSGLVADKLVSKGERASRIAQVTKRRGAKKLAVFLSVCFSQYSARGGEGPPADRRLRLN